ncbi:ROK family protein [Thalassovita sp.]|nr:ROK family protein [Thalassovita sp.]
MFGLVGDFGGTNCRLALARAGQVEQTSQRVFRNADFASPLDAISEYLSQMGIEHLGAVCLGVAGPVQAGKVRLTNYPWALSETEIASITGAGVVTLLNDLQAQGYALHALAAKDRSPVVQGAMANIEAPRLIVAIGTGVNAAVAFPQGRQVFVPPSESGHMALPIRDETDLSFASSVQTELGHCPVEAALSGRGLARLWQFFGGPAGQDGAAVTAAFEQGDMAADAALRQATLYLARYCADLALVHLPLGGIYLAGSVGLALAPHLGRLGFAEAFHRPGPYAEIHRSIPVYAVPDMQLTLAGCATRLLQDLG